MFLLLLVFAGAAEPPPSIDLATLVSRVLAAWPDRLGAIERLRAAEVGVGAVSAWDPLRAELMVAPLTGMPDATLSLVPMPPGVARAGRAMARAEVDMARADARMVELELAVDAAALWAEHHRLGATLPILDEALRVVDGIETSARERYARGLGPVAPALAAARERAMLEADRAELVGRERAVRARVNTLLGQAVDSPIPAAAWGRPPRPPESAPVAVAAAAADLAEAEARVAMARAERGPALGGMLAWQGAAHAVDDRLMAGVMVELPLDRGALAAAVREAEGEVHAARARHDALLVRSRGALAAAAAEADGAWAMAETLRARLLPAAEAEAEAARGAYASGHGDAGMWLMAEMARLDARRAVVDAEAEVWRMESMVWMAAGRLPEGFGGAP